MAHLLLRVLVPVDLYWEVDADDIADGDHIPTPDERTVENLWDFISSELDDIAAEGPASDMTIEVVSESTDLAEGR